MSDSTAPTQLPSSAEMAALDAATITSGITPKTLMERAGKAVLKAASERYTNLLYAQSAIVILCGNGNNGGDGLVIARALREAGLDPCVVLVSAQQYSKQNQEQLSLYLQEGGRAYLSGELPRPLQHTPNTEALVKITIEELRARVSQADFVFDALLGTGQRSAPRSHIAELLRLVLAEHRATAKIISIDIPTGLDADSGAAYDPHIKADLTVAIALIKRGLVQSPAFELCGEIKVVDIGIAVTEPPEFSALTRATAPSFPVRRRDAHKGSAGKVFVIGGSEAMPGAPVLSALGALRAGAGIVVATRLDSGAAVTRPLEIIDLPLHGAALSLSHLDSIKSELGTADAVVLGPGLGRSHPTRELLRELLSALKDSSVKTVIDADALNLLVELECYLLWSSCVVTPHPGEAGRLLGSDVASVQSDRYAAARSLAQRTQATTVLKGASTIVYQGDRGAVNTSGNPWMATAGSGDILAGVVAALMAQGLACFDAASLGVYLHGVAGDLANKAHNGPITASDIATMIPHAAGVLR